MKAIVTILTIGLLSSSVFASQTDAQVECRSDFGSLKVSCKAEGCDLTLNEFSYSRDDDDRMRSDSSTIHSVSLMDVQLVQKSDSKIKIIFKDKKHVSLTVAKDEEKDFLRLSINSSVKGLSDRMLKALGAASVDELAYNECEIK